MDSRLFPRVMRFYRRAEVLKRDATLGDGLWPVEGVSGLFLHELVLAGGYRRVVEIGAGVGFSTVWLGLAVQQTGGCLMTFEYFPPKIRLLEQHVRRFGLEACVDIVPSDFRRGRFRRGIELVFLDCRKCDYLEALQLLIPYLSKGCLVVADNAISHGRELLEYLEFVRTSALFLSELMPTPLGLEVSRYMG